MSEKSSRCPIYYRRELLGHRMVKPTEEGTFPLQITVAGVAFQAMETDEGGSFTVYRCVEDISDRVKPILS